MNTYTLSYARCVLLKREIQAESEDEALEKAHELENAQELGFDALELPTTDVHRSETAYKAKEGSWVADIQDDEFVWEVELI